MTGSLTHSLTHPPTHISLTRGGRWTLPRALHRRREKHVKQQLETDSQNKLYHHLYHHCDSRRCGKRYSGPLCQYCSDGHFPLVGFDYCYPCFESPVANAFALWSGFMFVLVLWFVLAVGVSSATVTILLSYLQMLNMIQVAFADEFASQTHNICIARKHSVVISLPLHKRTLHLHTFISYRSFECSCSHIYPDYYIFYPYPHSLFRSLKCPTQKLWRSVRVSAYLT